ncbi:hypothetical protein ONS95_009433 [Cadophora gregata]|uniref:uncharacterized protein n=1 Tax=Cadophora gregata TaxID=51156 RepID=UPI0026DB2CE0|nr:uncharacterized protein ONS95_009433 [Cadophora gregata]KAK0124481.1 hypothetical protein ONS95_009433 [Cadophora gregata]KAK0129665.1 hypothetical protein ONS96_000228 [Cadophora gregata f. sp. sojae]
MSTDKQNETSSAVAIIGGGPVGLYAALLLGQAGIETHVFERESHVLQTPRAAAYFPVTLDEFKKSGIHDDVVNAGFKNTVGVSWRKPKDGGVLAFLGGGDPDKFAVHLGQHELSNIILGHLKKYPNVTVRFGTTFVELEEEATKDQVRTHLLYGPDGTPQSHVSRFVVAADGGKSSVRKFLDIPLEGFTWKDFRIVAANIEYDLENESDWGTASYIVDPELWSVVAKLGKGPFWRIASSETLIDGDSTDSWNEAEGLKWMQRRLAAVLPGNTEKAKIIKLSPYRIHQRCASTFRKGNIVLAGDAAHLTNPTGGLGLTTGFMDAALLVRVLKQILIDGQSSALLDFYAETRRKVFLEYTSPTAIANLLRLKGTDPEVQKEREYYFDSINKRDTEFLINLGESELGVSSTWNV